MRRSRIRSRGARQKRDLIWFTQIVDLDVTDTAASQQQLLTFAEWTAVPAVSFERGVLLRVVGNLIVGNTASGTAADAPALNLAIVKQSIGGAAVDTTSLTDINSVDLLWVQSAFIGASTIATAMTQQHLQLDLTTKRKISIDDVISLCGRITADTASPTGTVRGILRFLVDRT